MFDIFGMNKADAKQAIQEMMCGCTRGMLEGYEFRLEEKESEIRRLREQLAKLEDYEKKYNELLDTVDVKIKVKKK